MGWLKRLFSGKAKSEEQIVEEVAERTPQDLGYYPNGKKIHTCKICDREIGEDERWTKRAGMWFHKKCLKKQMKVNGMSSKFA